MNELICSITGMILEGENQGTWRETCPTVSSNTTNLIPVIIPKACLWQMNFFTLQSEFWHSFSKFCACIYTHKM